MTFPAITSAYAGILSVIFTLLSFWVVGGRGQYRVLHGDGGQPQLNSRIRAHANFAEYVPMILLLTALYEASGGSRTGVHWLLAPLVLARLLHPVGMLARENSVQQFAFRAPGAVITLMVLLAASVMLLRRVL